MCYFSWRKMCFMTQLFYSLCYVIIGSIQVVAGVFFFFYLPILKLGSNICIGSWSILFGIGGMVFSLFGKWTYAKQRILLYISIGILCANVINLVVLEVGEWHILAPQSVKAIIKKENFEILLLYARTFTSLLSVLGMVVSFVAAQLTFCSLQTRKKVKTTANEVRGDLSDEEYVLPRVKSGSDDNENESYFGKPNPPTQSWVFESEINYSNDSNNSSRNRLSNLTNDSIDELRATPSENDYNDISSRNNLNIDQPIVIIENATVDYTDRQLNYMASFSRTPSPIGISDSSSQESCFVSPLYDNPSSPRIPRVIYSPMKTSVSVSPVTMRQRIHLQPCPKIEPLHIPSTDLTPKQEIHHQPTVKVEVYDSSESKFLPGIKSYGDSRENDNVCSPLINQTIVRYPISDETNKISEETTDTINSSKNKDYYNDKDIKSASSDEYSKLLNQEYFPQNQNDLSAADHCKTDDQVNISDDESSYMQENIVQMHASSDESNSLNNDNFSDEEVAPSKPDQNLYNENIASIICYETARENENVVPKSPELVSKCENNPVIPENIDHLGGSMPPPLDDNSIENKPIPSKLSDDSTNAVCTSLVSDCNERFVLPSVEEPQNYVSDTQKFVSPPPEILEFNDISNDGEFILPPPVQQEDTATPLGSDIISPDDSFPIPPDQSEFAVESVQQQEDGTELSLKEQKTASFDDHNADNMAMIEDDTSLVDSDSIEATFAECEKDNNADDRRMNIDNESNHSSSPQNVPILNECSADTDILVNDESNTGDEENTSGSSEETVLQFKTGD